MNIILNLINLFIFIKCLIARNKQQIQKVDEEQKHFI